jgi:hypothetical protein
MVVLDGHRRYVQIENALYLVVCPGLGLRGPEEHVHALEHELWSTQAHSKGR